MITDFQFFSLITSISLLVFWLIPHKNFKLRKLWIVSVSLTVIFVYSPVSLVLVLGLLLTTLMSKTLFKYSKKATALWLTLILCICPLILVRLDLDQTFIVSFGIAFCTIRAIALILTHYRGIQSISPSDSAFFLLFFPLFTAGPVEKLSNLRSNCFKYRLDLRDVWASLYRITTGLFLLLYVCNDVLIPIRDGWYGRDAVSISNFNHNDAYSFIAISFLYTYINFSGFSSVAIGISRLFGLKVAENFNFPLLATNPMDFWKRYHISMGAWIRDHIHFPASVFLLRFRYGPSIATIVSFTCFGLWHEFTVKYFFWGVLNGTLIVLYNIVKSSQLLLFCNQSIIARYATKILGWFLTITTIASIQTIANLASVEEGFLLVLRLFSVFSG